MIASGTADGHTQNGHASGRPPLTPVSTVEGRPAEAQPVAPQAAAAPAEGDRDKRGRFAAGNKAARGNPFNRRLAAMRQVLLDTIDEAKLRALVEALHAQALAGDVAAARTLLAYVVGKPAASVDPDALDRDEWKQCQEWPEEPFPFAWLRKRSFAEAVQALQTMSELGQDKVVRVYPPEEANADD
jgi:hypothetical protein